MKFKLKEIATLNKGLIIGTKDFISGKKEVMQIKYSNIDNYLYSWSYTFNPKVISKEKIFIDPTKKNKEIYIKNKDIIFSVHSKTLKPKLVTFDDEVNKDLYIYNPEICIIRIKSVVLPEYLYYFLKYSEFTTYSSKYLSIKAIENIEIDIPDIEIQKNMIIKAEQVEGNFTRRENL